MSELLLIVTLAGQRVAIPAAEVESVVEIEGLTQVPRAPRHVAGLSALRSRVLTVIDCFASLELAGPPARAQNEAIVVNCDGHPYALLVDCVEDVLEFSAAVRPLRTLLEGGWRRVARGMVEAGEHILLLIDPSALIAGPSVQAT